MFLLDRLHLTEDSICPITFLSKISSHSSPSEKKTTLTGMRSPKMIYCCLVQFAGALNTGLNLEK